MTSTYATSCDAQIVDYAEYAHPPGLAHLVKAAWTLSVDRDEAEVRARRTAQGPFLADEA